MSERKLVYPVVMRMRGLWPRDMVGYERHRLRRGGDLGHVDPSRSGLNERLIGKKSWAQDTWNEIGEMRAENHVRELEQLKKRRRKAEMLRRIAEGPRDPWRATRHGPMREIILTANRQWFEDDLTEFLGESGPTREQEFEARAISWLEHHFGGDCVHARADRDEEAYHIHAVILPRATTKDGRRMLQPSVHPMIRDYETAQDDVGAWFADIGLTRGERRKQAIRNALDHNKKLRAAQEAGDDVIETLVDVPQHRQHVSPRQWRERQELKLAERQILVGAQEVAADARDTDLDVKADMVERREAEVGAVLSIAAKVAEGRVDPVAALEEGSEDLRETDEPPSAAGLFARALAVLRTRARDEARSELKSAFAEIQAADAAIVGIAQQMPAAARKKIAAARKSLTRSIIGLHRTARSWLPIEKDPDRDG